MTHIPLGCKIYRILSVLCFFFCLATAYGQMGSYDRYQKCLVNASANTFADKIYINETSFSGESYPKNPRHGSISYTKSYASGRYEIVADYTPDADFVGLDTAIVEMRFGQPVFLARIYYLEFVFEVVPSIVSSEKDYFTVEMNSLDNELNVLANDQSTAGSVSIQNIPARMAGQFNIAQDQLLFSPKPDFTGLTYGYYTVCDSVGTCEVEIAHILVKDPAANTESDTVELNTAITRPLTEFLKDPNHVVLTPPANGSLEFINGTDAFRYVPGSSAGADAFTLGNGFSSVHYTIDVLEHVVNSFAMNDYYSVLPNDRISFDVRSNDRTDNFLIDSYTQPSHGTLVRNGQSFEYHADSLYEGVVTFEYTVCAVQNCETATVEITCDDFAPSTDTVAHQLTGLKNRAILVNYDVPVEAYTISIASMPTNGIVQVYAGQDTVSEGCVVSTGRFMFEYVPDSGFEGFDQFTVSYCASGACHDVVVSVEVLGIPVYDTCECQDQCVWPGDVNHDGRVNMTDLLCLGKVMGAQGEARPHPDGNTWYGQYGEMWGLTCGGVDICYADANGNGRISVADTAAISTFYEKSHTVLADEIVRVKPYAIGLEHDLDSTPVIGDTVTLYLTVGHQAFPARDLTGVAMKVSLSPDAVDSSYTRISPVTENWITREGMPLFMNKNDKVNFDLGLSRLDNAAMLGYGRVFALDIIIDDDLDGLRTNDNKVEIPVYVSGINGIDQAGATFEIPDQRLVFEAKVKPEETVAQNIRLAIFPNPATDVINFSEPVANVEIADNQGRLVSFLDRATSKVDVSNLSPGIYTVHATTSTGVQIGRFVRL